MPDRVLEALAAAISGHITHLYHQTAGDLALESTIRWASERARGHPALLRLPLLACEATGGDPAGAIPVAAAWHLFHCAAHLLDSAADDPLPLRDPADGSEKLPEDTRLERSEAATSRVINDAVTLVFLAQVSLTTLRRSGVTTQRIVPLVAAFNTAAMRMALGQARDLAWNKTAATLDDYWRMAGAKSGEFFGLACRAGAMLGTDDQAEIDKYGSFGYHLGVLVQLGDDLQALWKPRNRGDLITAERTLPVVYACAIAPATTRDRLHILLQHLGDDPDALCQLRIILANVGALHYLTMQAGLQHQLAYEALLSSARPAVAQHELSRLLDAAFPAVVRHRWASPRELANN